MAHEEGTDRAVPAGKSMSFYMSTAACFNRVSIPLLYSRCWHCGGCHLPQMIVGAQLLRAADQVIEMINTTMRSSLAEQHDADKAVSNKIRTGP